MKRGHGEVSGTEQAGPGRSMRECIPIERTETGKHTRLPDIRVDAPTRWITQ
jgi:hypothetical protein